MRESIEHDNGFEMRAGSRALDSTSAERHETIGSQVLPEQAVMLAEEERAMSASLDAAPLKKDIAPSVSVVIPCYNEERFISKVLENLAGQYESDRYEIIVVDGKSTDGTRKVVADFMAEHKHLQVRLVENPARNIPTALNLGIKNARGEIIVRMDAHSVPSKNYVRSCVAALSDESVMIVGMPWRIQAGADTTGARGIALAVSHPFGIGDAKYRLSSSSSEFVDTVPFGVFRKELWQRLGGFNEELLANEDYDFNYRVRSQGGRIMLDTSGHSDYFARPTFSALATQYFRYGRWKAQMVKLHPRSIRLRQLVAPLFVIALIALTALSLWWKLAFLTLLTMMIVYGALAFVFALRLARREGNAKLVPAICLTFFIIHVAWGSSFLLGLVRSPRG